MWQAGHWENGRNRKWDKGEELRVHSGQRGKQDAPSACLAMV